jgi:hypothetical protein
VTFPFSVKTDGTPIGPVKVLTGRQAPPEGATALDADRALSACIAAATQVMANGVDGAYGSALMESTPDVALGGTQEDLDRFATLTEEIQQEAKSMALDVDAMFDAMASLDGEADDTGAAEMKRVYLQKAEENVAKARMIRAVPHKLAPRSDARCSEKIHQVKRGTTAASATLDPCVVQIVQGMSPAGQNFRVQLSQGARRGAELESVDDDGGSPVNLISPTKAALLIEQNLARPLSGKSLYDHFSSVVSASGHDLGYTGDLQVTIHPVDRTGKPSRQGFPIRVHIVSKYDGGGLLIGTQQHILWQLETSYKTGLKTITAKNGVAVTFPFSVKTDGTPIGPVKVLTGRQAPPEDEAALDADAALGACIAAATQVMANGVAGAYGSAMRESTPDIAMDGSKEDLDRFAALTEEIQQEATAIALGAPTRGPLEAEPGAPPLLATHGRQQGRICGGSVPDDPENQAPPHDSGVLAPDHRRGEELRPARVGGGLHGLGPAALPHVAPASPLLHRNGPR